MNIKEKDIPASKQQTSSETEEVDSSHKIFIEIMYDVENTVSQNTNRLLLPIMQRLDDYSRLMMKKMVGSNGNVQDKEEMMAQYKLFQLRLMEFKHEYNYNNPYLANRMLTFLKKWLISNIIKGDKEYREIVFEYLKKVRA